MIVTQFRASCKYQDILPVIKILKEVYSTSLLGIIYCKLLRLLNINALT